MPKGLGLSVAAGLASALVFLTAVYIQGLFAPLLYVVALPLMALGLSRGVASAATASAVALVAVGAIAGSAMPVYLGLAVMPALLLVRQGLLCRTDGAEAVEWYPPGLLLGWLTAAAVALVLLAAGLLAANGVGIEALVSRHVSDFVGQMAAQMGDEASGPLRDQLTAVTAVWSTFLPALMGSLWLLMAVGNGLAGQWLAQRSGQAIRPWPRLRPLDLPGWLAPAIAAAAALALVAGGDLGYLGRNVAVLLLAPYLLAGLAEVHLLAEGQPKGRMLLTAFYIGFVLFAGWSPMAVAGFGLVRHWTRLHRRGAGGGQEKK